ncbi:MAG: extracellular solute-binding protein [Oscillospiraceae bacterium]|jgi:multiple sugar transport system substrate-binding protein|nr:extracellular solute-binding protein [Oscillospiraceae bacterium]
MKKIIATLLCAVLLGATLSGCSLFEKKKPVTLTMWHNFGGDIQKGMDVLIDEFNGTVGQKQGIIINVTAITSSAELQDGLNMILNGDPGAPAMPDIFTSYPKTAILFQQKGLLANLDEYFTAKERSEYIPAFMDEGRFGDGGLYVFPFAKSTEVTFINSTLFEGFSAATGVTEACFASFEGIADAAQKYYEWTDAETPDVADDGKQFYTADSWFNLAQAGMLQQGTSLFDGEALSLDNAAYRRIWETVYAPSVEGGFAVYDGFSSDLSKTGDIICSTGSTAGILFYSDKVTYPDNTVIPVEYSVLPYPVFEGGDKYAIQRGNGLCVAKADKVREEAAATFLKWFTAAEQNMRFVGATGYLPVTGEAFETQLPEYIKTVEDSRIKMMLETATEMYDGYGFFVAPTFEAFDGISKQYESGYKARLSSDREGIAAGDAVSSDSALTEFIASQK